MTTKWLLTYKHIDGKKEDFACGDYAELLETVEYFDGRPGEVWMIIEITHNEKDIKAVDVTGRFFDE